MINQTINNQKEYILCAAIHYTEGELIEYQPRNITTGYVVSGRRHHNCILLHKALTGKNTRVGTFVKLLY